MRRVAHEPWSRVSCRYEDEGRLQIYEQASPSYVSDERARERADAARREYRDRLRELKDQIQEAVVRQEHSVL